MNRTNARKAALSVLVWLIEEGEGWWWETTQNRLYLA